MNTTADLLTATIESQMGFLWGLVILWAVAYVVIKMYNGVTSESSEEADEIASEKRYEVDSGKKNDYDMSEMFE